MNPFVSSSMNTTTKHEKYFKRQCKLLKQFYFTYWNFYNEILSIKFNTRAFIRNYQPLVHRIPSFSIFLFLISSVMRSLIRDRPRCP